MTTPPNNAERNALRDTGRHASSNMGPEPEPPNYSPSPGPDTFRNGPGQATGPGQMRLPITATQLDKLADFVATLRPGQPRWTPSRVRTELTLALGITTDPELLARAAIRAATDHQVRGPEVIPCEGLHWEGVYLRPPLDTIPAAAGRHCAECGDIHVPGSPHTPREDSRIIVTHDRAQAARDALHRARETQPA